MYKKIVITVLAIACIQLFAISVYAGSVDVTKKKLSTKIFPDNCVKYARYYVPSLPFGLNTMGDKLRIVNSHTAKKGSVAIIRIDSGPYKGIGHVAVVVDVDKDGSKQHIVIHEANYPSYGNWEREAKGKKISDCEKALNIVGYFKP